MLYAANNCQSAPPVSQGTAGLRECFPSSLEGPMGLSIEATQRMTGIISLLAISLCVVMLVLIASGKLPISGLLRSAALSRQLDRTFTQKKTSVEVEEPTPEVGTAAASSEEATDGEEETQGTETDDVKVEELPYAQRPTWVGVTTDDPADFFSGYSEVAED